LLKSNHLPPANELGSKKMQEKMQNFREICTFLLRESLH
jgi:hypothetical protein